LMSLTHFASTRPGCGVTSRMTTVSPILIELVRKFTGSTGLPSIEEGFSV
jgi:hypothetical protein